MIRVGFLLNASHEWMGGFNYYRNLLYALSQIENSRIKPLVFLGNKCDSSFESEISAFAETKKVAFLDKRSPSWFAWRATSQLFQSDFAIRFLVRRFKIDVLSHSDVLRVPKIKTLNWIPDFQHFHLPNLFSPQDLRRRDRLIRQTALGSDRIVVSSQTAKEDLIKFTPSQIQKIDVLHFVGYPSPIALTTDEANAFAQKHTLDPTFFFLPNQFWQHKNHQIVLEALKVLKHQGLSPPQVVCSGFAQDYRNRSHFENLQIFVNTHQLNVRFVGLISKAEVTHLMLQSVAVLNPSLFEGWSTTVEECKSLGKNMILSDIPVHREQNPSHSHFFAPNDSGQLARLMHQVASNPSRVGAYDAAKLEAATQEFANRLQAILMATHRGQVHS